ncbi:MAG: hypothetical protein EOO29_57955 [Comamonadaceae bacterium]|nr:MAG: hypothetical protein EOO29_57955 [Comamonadaceae bacterium]
MDISQDIRDAVHKAQQRDNARPGLPGEHWLTLGAGLLILRGAGRRSGFFANTVGRLVGGALIARAASGRDGVVGKLLRGTSGVGGLPRSSRRSGG